MRRIILLILVIVLCTGSVSAMEYTAPDAPESVEDYMPEESRSFGEDLWYIIKSNLQNLSPSIAETLEICVSLIALNMLLMLISNFAGTPKNVVALAGTVAVGIILLKTSNALIRLGVDTVTELTEYGKLLIPVLTAALASQGGISSSAALYAGTILFNSILCTGITKLIVPMIYIYIALSVAANAIGEEVLNNLRSFIKWIMTWCLKIIIYVFTGYIGITGVVSGTTDAAAIKATKLAINGMVPVVGSIISDASESILVSAGVMKSAVGVYGVTVLFAIWITPFMKIGLQYVLLKATAGICGIFGSKQPTALIKDFSGVLGLLLAMTGTVCMMLLISTVCFMKGVS